MSISMVIKIVIAIWAVIIAAVVAIRIVNKNKTKTVQAGHMEMVGNSNRKNRLFTLYKIYKNNAITRKTFSKVESRIRLLYPADEISIHLEATKTMNRGFRRAGIVFGILTSMGVCNVFLVKSIDFYYILLGAILAWRIFIRTVKGRLEQAEFRLLKQYSNFLFNDLVPSYQKHHGHLDEAIYSVIDELPTLMALHATRIYDVVKSPKLEEAAAAYADYAPNNFFTSLVSLIVPTKLYGDKTLEDGKTTFIKGIMNLNKQLNEELLMKQRLDAAFSSLSIITLSGVFMMPMLRWFFAHFFPQTTTFFNGTTGIVVELIIFIVTFLCDYLIDALKNTSKQEIREHSVWEKLANRPALSPILNVQYSRHFTVLNRIDRKMKATGDHTGIKAYMVECAAYALIAFVVVNVFFGTSLISRTKIALNDFSNDFTNVIVPSETYKKQMEAISTTLTYQYKGEHLTDDDIDRVKDDIRNEESVIKSDEYVTPTAEAIIAHNKDFHNVYFKFWYEFIAILAAVVAFNTPKNLLSFKAKAMEMGKEDEVNSFNLLATIFMDMDGIKVETLLEWMERFSYYYKEAIVECIVTYPMGKTKALNKLKDYDTLDTFQRFIESLLNIDEVGMKKAFADIEIQQDFYAEKRKADNETLINRKRNAANTIGFIPFYATMALWMGLPMGLYAYSLFKQFSAQISSLM